MYRCVTSRTLNDPFVAELLFWFARIIGVQVAYGATIDTHTHTLLKIIISDREREKARKIITFSLFIVLRRDKA